MHSSTIFAFVTALATASTVSAHMKLVDPIPYRSANSPGATWQNIDYSMTEPLGKLPYPCKGYINPTAPSVATWSAGSTINYQLEGTAIHGGGSCQIVLSYDQGKTWNVIYSIIGGCVIEGLTESVKIPEDAPSGEAIFGWNWFNEIGNREMYQNCAPVTITNGGSGLNSDDYPAPFVANVPQAPGCGTIAGVDVVFPHPGKNVKYGGVYAKGKTPEPGAGVSGSCASGAEAPPPASGGGDSSVQPSSSSSAVEGGSTLYSGSSTASATASATSSSSTALASAPNLAADHTGASTSSGTSSTAAGAAASSTPTSTTTSPKKCKRKRSSQTIAPARRHERLVRRSAHERLVRRRVQRDLSAEQLSR